MASSFSLYFSLRVETNARVVSVVCVPILDFSMMSTSPCAAKSTFSCSVNSSIGSSSSFLIKQLSSSLPALPPRTIPPPLLVLQFSRFVNLSSSSVLVHSDIPIRSAFICFVNLPRLFIRAWRTCQSNTTPPLQSVFLVGTRARLHVPRVSSYPLPPSIIFSLRLLRVSFPRAEENFRLLFFALSKTTVPESVLRVKGGASPHFPLLVLFFFFSLSLLRGGRGENL